MKDILTNPREIEIHCKARDEGFYLGYNKALEELKGFMFGRMDWFKVFRDAYESRKTSWHELGHIQEWRNATDEILFAVWRQIEEELNKKQGDKQK